MPNTTTICTSTGAAPGRSALKGLGRAVDMGSSVRIEACMPGLLLVVPCARPTDEARAPRAHAAACSGLLESADVQLTLGRLETYAALGEAVRSPSEPAAPRPHATVLILVCEWIPPRLPYTHTL
jgi:hypothetical protein